MGLFRRSKVDTNAWQRALTGGTIDDFLAVYDPAHVNTTDLGRSPLLLALINTDPVARVGITNRLLDDGAHVHTRHPLHVLLAQTRHNPELEAALLARLIDAGAPVNDRTDDGMTSLEQAATQFKFSDATLQPFYDVLLARPDIDLLGPGLGDRPVLINLRKWYAKRALLVEQAEAVLVSRGTDIPPPTS